MRAQHEHQTFIRLTRWSNARERGSVLIIVLWIAFGLVAIALYFADSMGFEYRAADNRLAGSEAEQTIEGAARYVNYVLSNPETPGLLPDPTTYQVEAAPVGNAFFWLIGRGDNQLTPETPTFGLIDEASKLNLNAPWVDANVLALLPRMTADIASSIVAWRSTTTNIPAGGVGSETYMRLQPPYMCKNGPFETIDELRLIYGMNMEILYGEDANLNGILDPNESDGDTSPPTDNHDGHLDPGVLEYVTVYSSEPTTWTNGVARLDLTSSQSRNALTPLLRSININQNRITAMVALVGQVRSPLEFYIRSGMTLTEFAQIEGALRGASLTGLINVNTASAVVLACIPGMDSDKAAQIITYRQSNPDTVGTVSWVKDALNDTKTSTQVGPYITGRSYQCTADVAAIGHYGRGYRRVRFVFDTTNGITNGAPRILYRRDLSHLGWALGKQVRSQYLTAKKTQ